MALSGDLPNSDDRRPRSSASNRATPSARSRSGAGLASLNRLAERWQQATDEERAAAREGGDQVISALMTQVVDLEVPPVKPAVRPAPEEDGDFEDFDDFTEERYTGPANR